MDDCKKILNDSVFEKVLPKGSNHPEYGASQSMTVFAKWSGLPVVYKISPISDDGLNAEIFFYKNTIFEMSGETPHLVPYLCATTHEDVQSIFKNHPSLEREVKRQLNQIWLSEGANILITKRIMFDENRSMSLLEFLQDEFTSLSSMDQYIFIQSIMFQVAHVLWVFERHQFMHHDLHLANILLEMHRNPKSLYYPIMPNSSEPRVLMWSVIANVFDFDFSSEPRHLNPRLTTTFCKTKSLCNFYKKNWDWWKFLFVLDEQLKALKIKNNAVFALISNYLKTNAKHEQMYKKFGNACMCQENCNKCEPDRDVLEKTESPIRFIEDYLSGDSKQQFERLERLVPPQEVSSTQGAKPRRTRRDAFVDLSLLG